MKPHLTEKTLPSALTHYTSFGYYRHVSVVSQLSFGLWLSAAFLPGSEVRGIFDSDGLKIYSLLISFYTTMYLHSVNMQKSAMFRNHFIYKNKKIVI